MLRTGDREVLTFENSMERRKFNFRQYYVDGIALLTGGRVLLVIGFALGFWKRRKSAAARKPTAQS
ncbi:MAG: hypothetical protein ACOVN4_16455 [Bosea sp. (in: a-proteobacteria)]